VNLTAWNDLIRRRLRALFAPTADASDNLLTGPIRGELLGTDRLADRARELARSQRLRGTRQGDAIRTPLLSRLEETASILADIRARLAAATETGGDVGPAGDWLLDNAHVVEEHVREVRESLPRTYYRELPELDSGHLAGYPRVYEIATTLIGHSEGRIDRVNTDLFVSAFQEIQPLLIGELWAIPAMLRLALIENVRRMALRTVQRLDQVELADRWAERITLDGERDRVSTSAALNDFLANHPPLTPIFVSRFLRQVRHADETLTSLAWLEPWMSEVGVDADDAATRSNERLALTQVTTANSITSLRAIARLDWKSFVEGQSQLEEVLLRDPSGTYRGMTFATRDSYRHAVERLARRSGLKEEDVAHRAVQLAEEASATPGANEAQRHVGYYLVDDGLATLRTQIGYRNSFGESVHQWVLQHPNLVFIGGVVPGTAVAVAAAVWLAGAAAWTTWPLILALLLITLVPASDIAVSLVNQLVTAFLPPRVLPKLDLSGPEGIPPEFRTAVVIPTLFGSVEDVQEALDTIEVQFLANREAHLHFAILSDFTDADRETRDGDDEIVATAVAGIKALNARYAEGRADEFYLLHRARVWNARQGVWMGWERKRGKLAQFNQFVRGGAREAFAVVVGDVSYLRDVRYAITLDADTVLPPAAAPLLVGALAHPLNRAVYDASRARVVRGYGILQPRVGVSLPSAYRSRFAAIHSGHPGVDPYTTAVSDVYQDLFGEGSFTGKGIYDIDAFEQATRGRFPENTLLSHDLIEGSFARAALATDIEVYDDYPTSYLAHARRKHRWIRGDWQLLRWITRRVPGPGGTEPNRLSLLSRWKIVDNLRRSTLELAQLVFFLAGWTILPGSPLRWTLLAVLAVAAPWIIALLLAVLRPPTDKSWRAYYGAVWQDAGTSLRQVMLALAFLPHQASISADAIARTLWRVLVSRRLLLQWQTASQAERAVTPSRGTAWRVMWPAVLIAGAGFVIVAVRGLAGGTSNPWALVLAVVPLSLLWLVSPALAYTLSVPNAGRTRRLATRHRVDLMRYARTHWQFFERFVSEETHWLAPDNFQEDPEPVVAMRTSPTNIGLQLLSTVSAFDLGFIPLDRMLERLERTVDTMSQLHRYRGHFYNWYDLRDLHVLEPAYISTVDSGNLAGHLIALRQALLALAEGSGRTPEQSARLLTLAAQAGAFEEAMDFRFLFDEDRELFSIGYQQGSQTLDASSYDLLASEARLTSFVAIARNQIPVDHWFRLGRTLTRTAGEAALVSWSGSMFEYLMPALVMRTYPLTVIDQTYRGAVRRQIRYGEERSVPWGLSESAYNLRDRQLTYQYRAFGVPDLALKRGLGRDLVIAPYASALAAMVDPAESLENLAALEDRGALGPYGFFDALDYTRPAPHERFAVVRNYMAHHIGMSLVAFTNVLQANIWQRRFHADAVVRAVELLLHERIPRRLVFQSAQAAEVDDALPAPELERPAVREFDTADTPQPRVALLGHLPYTVMVNNRGSGYSHHEQLAVTRWRADATTDNMGQFCYVKELSSGRLWSAAHQPVCAPADEYRARFATDRVTFLRTDGDISTRTEITVVPGDAAEVRRVTVTNNGSSDAEVELTSYAEVVLATPDSDRAHPAFGNLFVETEWHEWCNALMATRRTRSSKDAPVWSMHIAAADDTLVGPVTYESDRARFIGRGRSTRDPAALDHDADGPLAGRTGAVLDPVFAVRVRLRLAPGACGTAAFTTVVASSRERAFELADRYDDITAAQRALDLAWTTAQVELRELDIAPADAGVYQDFAGHLLYADRSLGAPADERARNRGSQPLLWSIGISGDRPILLALVESVDGLGTLRQLLSAHRYWRRRGLQVDLVVLNMHPPSYLQDQHDRIMATVLASTEGPVLQQPGGVFVLRVDLLSPEALLMLRATARVHVTCDGRSLGRTVERLAADDAAAQTEPSTRYRGIRRRRDRTTPTVVRAIRQLTSRLLDSEAPPETSAPPASASAVATDKTSAQRDAGRERRVGGGDSAPASNAHTAHDFGDPLVLDNGVGGLTADNGYEIRLQGDVLPPAPWSNVIANARGGFVVTEQGGGFSWAGNSYFYRLTPWHNDPVSDPPGDVLYIRDDETGEVWTPTAAPIRHDTPYIVQHGAGVSTFAHEHAGVSSLLTLHVAPVDPVKLSLLRLTNRESRPRRLTVTAYVEWTLGVSRDQTRQHLHTSFAPLQRAIVAHNSFDPQFAGQRAFCTMSEPLVAHTADRREFLGRNGTTAAPVALRRSTVLSGRTGAGVDPCAVLQCTIELAPFESRELCVALGAGEGEAEVQQFVDRYGHVPGARAALDESTSAWRERLSVVRVETPVPALDAMVNQWALYQSLACRMWARSALYQSSGAFGFRDQLQDTMAYVYAEPAIARAHILTAAARQFVEGDVQHWWHPQSGRGVRTRFSDDLAWLPFVVDHYIRVTGDQTVLDEYVPFLAMRILEPHEHELYDLPQVTDEHGSVYEHCLRALRRACTTGAHGLPLIGIGDWNDGMSRVGVEGRGESVWLAWFLVRTLRQFAEHVEARGDHVDARDLREQADAYVVAIEQHGWDGRWYRRAFYDDGTPLGSSSSDDCRIDAIAQSWSVISEAGDPERQGEAMAAFEAQLVRNDARLLMLLTPPFDTGTHDPGYIKGYLPGVRENGAQYTHAALWSVMATAMRGDGDRAFELFEMLNPFTHTDSAHGVATYKVEPYVIAADVYTAEGQLGRGGWTWYTGSASWFYRVALESILGFTKRGDRLTIRPCVPSGWPKYRVDYRVGRTTYEITVILHPTDSGRTNTSVSVDGRMLEDSAILLVDDGGTHRVVVVAPGSTRA
jgi:cyclic beta-1,2-glucan synthetase